jgi:8-oxo-dGTP diphosphatase
MKQILKDRLKGRKMTEKYPRVGVGVLIFNNEGQLLLGKRQGAHGEGMWSAPGGHLEFGETFESCALREVFEETGVKISDPIYLGITNDVFREEGKHYVSIFMKAFFPEEQQVINKEPHKCSAWQWFSIKNLPENLFLPLKKIKKWAENWDYSSG